jgi:hypothetical protein
MTKILKYITGLLILFPLFFSARGQDVKVTSAFDSMRIFIGDQIKFTVTVDQPEGLKLALPAFKDTLVKDIEILSGPFVDSSRQNGRLKIIQKYLITSFDSGRYQIPPVFVEMKNENGLKRFYSDYSLLEVNRVMIAPADTVTKIFDIVKPYKAPLTVGEVLPWVLIAAVIGALAWLAVRYFRKLKSTGGEIEPVRIPDPAHIIAFRELEKLRDEKLWQNGEIKQYYTRLTEILRQYLENRFRVFSLEMTTSETLEALVKTGFKKDGSYNQLKDVLKGADLVKFAKYNPEPAEHESIFQESWNFVLATKEEPVFENRADADTKDKAGEAKL